MADNETLSYKREAKRSIVVSSAEAGSGVVNVEFESSIAGQVTLFHQMSVLTGAGVAKSLFEVTYTSGVVSIANGSDSLVADDLISLSLITV